MYLSIGQFSKICSVSVKTLRYYDSQNIIKPAFTDRLSGYRYYTEAQLEEMLIIKRLKRYGCSLAEIKTLNRQDKRALFSKLQEKIPAIKAEISHSEMLLEEIEALLYNFERTGEIMNTTGSYKIYLTQTEDMPILSSRQRMSVEDFGRYYGFLFEKIARQNIPSTGAVLAVYHDKEFDEKDSDIEVGIAINDPSQATRILKGGFCAKTTHVGPYSTLAEAYSEVVKEINRRGYKIIAPPYEIYRKSHVDGLPADKWETDIFFPIAK